MERQRLQVSDMRWLRRLYCRRGEASTSPSNEWSCIGGDAKRRKKKKSPSSWLFPLFVSCSADWRASNRGWGDTASLSVESNCLCRERLLKDFDPRRRKIGSAAERKHAQAQLFCRRRRRRQRSGYHRCWINFFRRTSFHDSILLLFGRWLCFLLGFVQMEAINII